MFQMRAGLRTNGFLSLWAICTMRAIDMAIDRRSLYGDVSWLSWPSWELQFLSWRNRLAARYSPQSWCFDLSFSQYFFSKHLSKLNTSYFGREPTDLAQG